MAELKETWHELSERLDALGLKLKLHREQTGDTSLGDALTKLGHSVQEAFEAASNAIHDEAVRADVKETGRLLADAVRDTVKRK